MGVSFARLVQGESGLYVVALGDIKTTWAVSFSEALFPRGKPYDQRNKVRQSHPAQFVVASEIISPGLKRYPR